MLRARDGEILAHLFENPAAGLERGLYWNLHVECEPVRLDGDDWEASLAVDWLSWPLRGWRELDGADLSRVSRPGRVEASVYLLGTHHAARLDTLSLRGVGCGRFEAAAAGQARIQGAPSLPSLAFSVRCEVRFAGVVVVPDNLVPKPVTAEAAQAAVAAFMGLEGLRAPRRDDWRFVLEPEP